MLLFLGSFLVISLAVLGMALGVILGRRPVISGCRSLRLGGVSGCGTCRDPCTAASSDAACVAGGRGPKRP